MSGGQEYHSVAHPMDDRSGLRVALAAIVAIGIVVSAVAFWRMGEGLADQACIAKAVAKFPAVPVSAYTGKAAGALKLSFVSERQKEITSCG